MANANFINQIRQHMDQLQREYAALSEAYRILIASGGGRGRRPSIPSLNMGDGSFPVVRTGRRGRPPGAKNKPGYKKPGPKPKNPEQAVAQQKKK
jgi:hypothetical protein